MPNNKRFPLDPAEALPGRKTPLIYAPYHAVNQHSIQIIPKSDHIAYFAMGCFGERNVYFGSKQGYILHR